MIDHVSLPVSNYKKAKEFYVKALAPLGYKIIAEYAEYKVAGFGVGKKPDLWIGEKKKIVPGHVAILAKKEKEIDKFHEAALRAGGKDNGKPGARKEYSPSYYAAFIKDMDGNNIEAVLHTHKAKK